jgi:hypothetical protein
VVTGFLFIRIILVVVVVSCLMLAYVIGVKIIVHGNVYKGFIDESTPVAIKRLKPGSFTWYPLLDIATTVKR